jgi:hypothetical protein
MKVHMTVADFMGVDVECGAFLAISQAKAHLDSNKFGPRPQIITCDVLGPLDQPGIVFTLSRLDHQADVHTFTGKVYGSYEEAHKAAGVGGVVRRHQL